MANFVFTVAAGKVAEKADNGETLRVLALTAADTTEVMRDLANIADVLANVATVEANFTNYSRQALSGVLAVVDAANNRIEVSADDLVYGSAGGAVNNTVVASIVYHDVDGSDANAVPLVYLETDYTTDGNDVTLELSPFFRANALP